MKNKLIRNILVCMMMTLTFIAFGVRAHAEPDKEIVQEEETADAEEERQATDLTFEVEFYTYEILPDASESDMPAGFTLEDWEYHGVPVKAGRTDNSNMVCVLAEDWDTGYQYRFIYDPDHDMFVPYFGTEIKNGYVYTIPVYEGAEVPYGFEEAYFLIQTVPMTTYKRMDAELTQEEIALGVLSDDNYLVFLMMDQDGAEVHYTYDLIDRTFQRALLQKKDAESVTELNEVIDKLHSDIGELNAINTQRMNQRLTIIGVLIAAVVIMAGVIINLLLRISRLKKDQNLSEEDEEQELQDDSEDNPEEDQFSDDEDITEEKKDDKKEPKDDFDLEIVDLDDL